MGTDGTWDDGPTECVHQGYRSPRAAWVRITKASPRLAAVRSPIMPGRRRLATRDAVHDSLRLTRHNGERDGSRMVAEEAARR